MYPQELGAHTSVFAGAAPRDNPEISHGAYIYPPNVAHEQASHALDEAKQKELYDFTESLLKEIQV